VFQVICAITWLYTRIIGMGLKNRDVALPLFWKRRDIGMQPNLDNTLYRSQFEHDACGIGFIARTTGIPGHDIVQMAVEAVGRMAHRSGIDADGMSGDGAGVLTQIPHRLLAAEISNLPAYGDYAVGMLFLPLDDPDAAVRLVEEVVSEETIRSGKNRYSEKIAVNAPSQTEDGNPLLTWRAVPVNVDALGSTAKRTRPEIRQIILRRPPHLEQGEPFERFLFAIRKKLVTTAWQQKMETFYVPFVFGPGPLFLKG
jgi:glutamate synthase domain-containing protein 1